MSSDKELPGNPDRSEAEENDRYDTRRNFRKPGDHDPAKENLEQRASHLQNDEELAGDPLGAETHRHAAEQQDTP